VSFQSVMGTMHGIINTVSASMSIHPYLGLLKPQGEMILVGLPVEPLEISAFALVDGKSVPAFLYAVAVYHNTMIISTVA
jgi:D-arabinose 1-dehydrogenase-like Zn-dependent alcohol dehydrogenase